MTEQSDVPEQKVLGGKAVGELNRKKFRDWLNSVDGIPLNERGGINVSELERILGINRSAFYTNPGLRKMLEDAIAQKGLNPLQVQNTGAVDSDNYTKKLEQRVKLLEQRLEAKNAESKTLRDQLKRFSAIEQHLLATGRLVK